ncbi:hypothetical protein DPMN_125412 [Dreissena polymorpha]|uniref:Uncharacterized protein n=1 Tax=Dreissena polymorpha TaxID=45954 RepID=A0A9D4GXQ7_DREPO|nr:hypothetical protein DPMN_125398 [Dreissena polymorpha]KAH3823603.1 hypothetical protein DPMN_125412 [Dreissena polymorpha]
MRENCKWLRVKESRNAYLRGKGLTFQHYGKEKVMSLAIPVVVKFLSTDHKELSHNVSSYLSLAAIDNADMLAQYMDLIVNSILKGKLLTLALAEAK